MKRWSVSSIEVAYKLIVEGSKELCGWKRNEYNLNKKAIRGGKRCPVLSKQERQMGKKKLKSASLPLDSLSMQPVITTITLLFHIYTETLATFCFVLIFSALILSTLEYKMEFRVSTNHTVLPLTTNNNNGDKYEDGIKRFFVCFLYRSVLASRCPHISFCATCMSRGTLIAVC